MVDQMLQDSRYAVRSLLKRPVLTAVAIASLALGIGVNTTIFSVFERLLLRTVQAPAVEDIVNVMAPGPKPGSRSTQNAGGSDAVVSYPLFRDLEKLKSRDIPIIAAHRSFNANVAHRGATMRAQALVVSGGYFPALGVMPAAGRVLTEGDDRVEGAHAVVVLSHRYWTTQFAADPRVIGETVVVNGNPMTIVGVAAEGFTGTVAVDRPELFVPLAMATAMRAGRIGRADHWLYLFARLQAGTPRERAEAALNGPFAELLRDVEYPAHASQLVGRAREQFLARRLVLEDGRRLRMTDREDARLILGLLLAMTGLVLLIACANVANLLLARAADRAGEMAVRVSMGASTLRLVRLLLVESSILGILGGVAALAVANAASLALVRIMPSDDAPVLGFELNAPVVLYALMIGMATALVFGLAPALLSGRFARMPAVTRSLRVSSSRGARRLRASLAAAQIALATALLAQAGLFITSLRNVARTELGIEREGLLTFRLAPYLNGYTPERAMSLFDRVLDELRQTPGVVDVTASTVPLLADSRQRPNVVIEGFEAAPDADVRASFAEIGEAYFRTLGIRILAGREFSMADRAGAPKVAIVNEAFARQFGLRSVIGVRVALATNGATTVPDAEIVGLVVDAKYSDVRETAPAQLYFPYRQGQFGPLTFYARASADARHLRGIIPRIVARADPNLPVERLRTMDEQVWDDVTRERVLATLSSWFAGLATLLAGMGLYAVLAFIVTQRVKEIGIRMALGARAVDVCRLLARHIGTIALTGGGIGLVVSLVLGMLGEALLFGVKGTNPVIVAGTVVVVGVVVLAAAIMPTLRATRVDPAITLRAE